MVEDRYTLLNDALGEVTAEVHGMIGAGGAIPGDRSGEFAGAGVEQEDGAAFGGDDVEERAEELPLERVNVAHGANGGADLEESREGAREADGGWKSGEGFGLQVEEIVRLELLRREAERSVVVELDGTAFGVCGGFCEKEEGRIADGDLIAESEHSFGDGDAVDEGA